MAKTFAEYAQERRDRMGSECRVFRAYYASLTVQEVLACAIEDEVAAPE